MDETIEMIKQKIPHILVSIGAIFIVLHSLDLFKQYLFLDKLAEAGKILDTLFFQNVFDSFLTNFVVSNLGVLFSSVIGFALAMFVVFYLVNIFREPSKNKFVILTALGVLAVFLSSGLGGILVAIGGFVGMRKYS